MRHRLNWFLATFVVFAAFAVVAFALFIWDSYYRDPFSWDLKHLFPGYITTDGTHYIRAIDLHGAARRLARIEAAEITSSQTGESLALMTEIDGWTAPKDLNPIPAGAMIRLLAYLGPINATGVVGLSRNDFMQHWSSFAFIVTINGRRHEYFFSSAAVRDMLDEAKRPQPVEPRATKKIVIVP